MAVPGAGGERAGGRLAAFPSCREALVLSHLCNRAPKRSPGQRLPENGIELVYFSMSTEEQLSKESNLPRGGGGGS